MGRREVADVFSIVCGMCIVSRWVAGRPFRNMDGCDFAERYV